MWMTWGRVKGNRTIKTHVLLADLAEEDSHDLLVLVGQGSGVGLGHLG